MKNKSLKLNAALNMIKQVCTIFFPLITIPYISRVLGTTHYGKFSFANSIVNYFLLLAGLGISTYAIREGSKIRSKKETINTFCSELFTINLFSMLISFSLLLLSIIILPKLTTHKLIISILSVSIFLQTVGTDWINSIFEDYYYLTLRYIFLQFIGIISIFIFVKKPEDYYLYAIIYIITSYGGNLINILYIRKYINLKIILKKSILRHLPSIFVLFFNAIAITIYVNSDISILGFLTSESDVGIYTLSSKIYLVIKGLINAIVIVTLPRIALLYGQKRLYETNQLLLKIFNSLIIIVFPIVVGLYFLSDWILSIIGGPEYISGTISLKLLSIALFFSCFASFFCTCIMLPMGKESLCLKASIISAAINILTNFIFIPLFGINGAALTTIFSEFLICCLYFYFCKKLQFFINNYENIVKSLISSCFMAALCYVYLQNHRNTIFNLLVISFASICIYFTTQSFLKNKFIIYCFKGLFLKHSKEIK